MPRFHTALFDLDGTLIDSIRLILDSYHHTLAAFGLPPRTDAEWLAGIGTPLRAEFARLAATEAEVDAMIAAYRAYNLAHHDDRVRPYAGVVSAVLSLAAQGVQLGVVTSKNRHGTARGLAVAGLEAIFVARVCADDVDNPKPHREPVDRAMALLGADPGATVFIGDSVHDMRAGRSAGVATAAALWGPFGRADLAPSEPDHWLDAPEDLVRLVLGP